VHMAQMEVACWCRREPRTHFHVFSPLHTLALAGSEQTGLTRPLVSSLLDRRQWLVPSSIVVVTS
jgi:hypothetical protein